MNGGLVFIVSTDGEFCTSVFNHFLTQGLYAECYRTAPAFLAGLRQVRPNCVILDMSNGLDGPQLQQHLAAQGYPIPVICVAEQPEFHTIVRAMRAGACDFLQKPVDLPTLAEQASLAVEQAREQLRGEQRRRELQQRIRLLTERENEVLTLALTGKSNKEISQILGISHRTVETHRSHIMIKVGIGSLLELSHVFATPQEASAPRLHRHYARDAERL